MPTDKDFKRLVRARMRRTGEAYTTARARLLRNRPAPAATAAPHIPTDYAALAQMSDETIKAKTGCTWERWVHALDRAGAHEWPHREIARHVRETYKVSGWWSQWVTTGYERIKGRRAVGQRVDGGFAASKSKVVPAALTTLYRAVRDGRTRRRWMGDVKVTVRAAVPDKSVRMTWPDGTWVELYVAGKGPGKSQIAVEHSRLPDREAVERQKAWWGERLTSLHGMLTRRAAPQDR